MEALSETNLSATVAETLQPVCRPLNHKGKRHRAIRPMHEQDMNLLKAVSDGNWTINGFRNRDIRRQLLGQDPADAKQRRRHSGQITRKLMA